jgi:two-component system sensor kinase FixL
MAAALAHEVNQPLTAVIAYARGCLRLLRQQTVQLPLLREGLDEAVHQAERAGIIINRLREFLYDGISHRSSVEVSEIVRAVLDLARPELVQNGIVSRLLIAPGLPRLVVDRIQIEQVLLNLVRNAIEAMLSAHTTQPRVTIAADVSGLNRVRIAVSDVGPGVADDIASRLFEPFTTTKPHGMGLGLSISRSIVQAHGGELELTRNPTGGTTFSFALPGHAGS